MAVDSTSVYVTDVGNNRVLKVPVAGGPPLVLLTGLNKATGVAVDSGGNLYVTDAGGNRVLKVPVGGGRVRRPGTRGGIDCDPSSLPVCGISIQEGCGLFGQRPRAGDADDLVIADHRETTCPKPISCPSISWVPNSRQP